MCGAAAATAEAQLVPDVEEFPGHIACDGDSQSEIVVPILHDGKVLMSSIVEILAKAVQVVAIIDIDCAVKSGFDKQDQASLEELARVLSAACDWSSVC